MKFFFRIIIVIFAIVFAAFFLFLHPIKKNKFVKELRIQSSKDESKEESKVKLDSKSEIYQKICNEYDNIKSYTSRIRVEVLNNLSKTNFVAFERYKAPNNYRIDYLSPKETAGIYYIFRNDEAYVFSPFRKKAFNIKNFTGPDCLHMMDFFRNYKENQKTNLKVGHRIFDSLVEFEISKADFSKHRSVQVLSFDAKTLLPVKFITFNEEKVPMVTVVYEEFKINSEVDDDFFGVE